MKQHSAASLSATSSQAVTVSLPPALLRLFPEAPPQLDVQATSVAEVFAVLDDLWPGMRDRLWTPTPAIRKHINVFVEGHRATLETALRPGTRVTILTAVSGG